MPWSALAAVGSAVGQGVFGSREATKNRRFQRDLSNTAYQRATRDMRAAGLNPMLAFQQGGASTPSGAMSPIPDVENPVSALQANRVARAQEENLRVTNTQIGANTDLTRQQERLSREQERLTSAEADQAEFTKKVFEKGLPHLENLLENPGDFMSSAASGVGDATKKGIQKLQEATGISSTGDLYRRFVESTPAARLLRGARDWWDRVREQDRNRRESRRR